MNLKHASLAAFCGLAYKFLLKFIGTVFPELFIHPAAAQTAQVLSLTASLTIPLFLSVFLQKFVRPEHRYLKAAGIAAMVGAAGMVILHIKGLFTVISGWQVWLYDVSPGMLGLMRSNVLNVWLPLLSAATFVIFLAVLYRELDEGLAALKKPVIWAGAGTFCGFLIVSFIAVWQLSGGNDNPALSASLPLQYIFIPAFVFQSLVILYFFHAFYKTHKV